MDLNGAKLESPIVLIDPTYKSRNALAALSGETFEKFQKVCREFLKNPSIKFFEIQKTDLAKIESDAKKKGQEFILLEAKTEKQEGDIAGSKLLKFYNNLSEEISRFFAIKKKGFNYNGKKSARFFFVATPLKEILVEGPSIKDSRNVKRFEKAHPDYFTKKGRIYAKERIAFGIREFMGKWTKKNSRKIKEMYVEALVII